MLYSFEVVENNLQVNYNKNTSATLNSSATFRSGSVSQNVEFLNLQMVWCQKKCLLQKELMSMEIINF